MPKLNVLKVWIYFALIIIPNFIIAQHLDKNTKNVVLEKSYQEYLEGFTDVATGEARRGYVEVVNELNERFPDVDEIVTEKDKKDFAKLFGEYLRVENILQNYDEFSGLKALQKLDINDAVAVENFKINYHG